MLANLNTETDLVATSVDWGDVERQYCPSEEQLLDWAGAAVRTVGSGASIRVVDESEMRQVNHRWRAADYATNVLSFPADLPVELGLQHLGDILICAVVVNREAVQQGKSSSAHWAHMVIHGMLHLQGFDHENDADACEMESLETQLLAQLGFGNPYGPVSLGEE